VPLVPLVSLDGAGVGAGLGAAGSLVAAGVVVVVVVVVPVEFLAFQFDQALPLLLMLTT
jgi:hypothetical protein